MPTVPDGASKTARGKELGRQGVRLRVADFLPAGADAPSLGSIARGTLYSKSYLSHILRRRACSAEAGLRISAFLGIRVENFFAVLKQGRRNGRAA